jgi:membrane-bound lytic murein transglycosylase B
MGPAQFIPSTWMMYRDRLHNILGTPANPWSIRDSFLASGVLLTDSGARSQTRDGEWRAAMIYFSGGTTNSTFFWYANQVVDRADQFERDIEIMLKNGN